MVGSTASHVSFQGVHPWKFTSKPKKMKVWFLDDFYFQTGGFQVPAINFRGSLIFLLIHPRHPYVPPKVNRVLDIFSGGRGGPVIPSQEVLMEV